MKTQKAFTLIELLVVISIIALLLSILLPALNVTKKHTQRVICMANLSQWGLILTLYTEDHDGHFFAGYYDYTDPNGISYTSSNSDLWPYALQSYYQVSELKFCPAAKNNYSGRYISRSGWGDKSDEIFSGSYGLNGWLGDTPEEVLETEGHDTSNSWRTMDYSGGANIPLMADAFWYTGRPDSDDLPPDEEGEFGQEGQSDNQVPMRIMPGMAPMTEPNNLTMPGMSQRYPESETAMSDYNSWTNRNLNHMQRFAVNRHRENLNVLFMDGMVKSISPKELWRLKWHKNYDTSAPLPEWPEWMEPFKDPD